MFEVSSAGQEVVSTLQPVYIECTIVPLYCQHVSLLGACGRALSPPQCIGVRMVQSLCARQAEMSQMRESA